MADRMKNENNGSKNLIYKILLVVFVIGLVVCGGMMAYENWQLKKAQEQYADVPTEKESESENIIETETESEIIIETETEIATEVEVDILTQLGITVPDLGINWEEWWAKNEHIYAWIYIPNTNVNYPVLQHPKDDTYYLNRNLDGSKGYPGCIYSERKYNSMTWTDFNTALYGHNMKDGSMFKTLHSFEDSTFFEQNRYAYIYTPDYVYVYDIFAAYVYGDIHFLAKYSGSTVESRQEYLDDIFGIRDMSAHFREGVEVNTDSKLLTLVTCIGGRPNNRYLVQGVLVNPPVVEETVAE